MELQFFCRDCGCEHGEPAQAGLGYFASCFDCTMLVVIPADQVDVIAAHPPIAA